MSTLSWSKIWTVCHNILGPICDVLPPVWRHVDVLSQDFSQHVYDVQPAFQQSVDILSHDFWTFVMSCHLLKIHGQNVTDFGTKYYSEMVCHTVTNRPNLLGRNVTILGGRNPSTLRRNPSTLRRNVTVVKCHSRWFVGWTDSVGRNVMWSVCGWTDRQCTHSML
jgi:hypothetical protein